MKKITLSESYKKALIHTTWHIIGTLLPVLIVLVVSFVTKNINQISNFISNGDFCLLSAAILTPAAYVLSTAHGKDGRIKTVPAMLHIASILIIIVASSIYAIIFLKLLFPVLTVDSKIVSEGSIIFLIISILIFGYSQLLFYKEIPSSSEIEKNDIQSLGEEFEKLG